MRTQVLLNILIAFVWTFLQSNWSLITFLSGYIIGLVLLFFMRRFLPQPFYFRKGAAIIKLLLLFLKELFLSSFQVAKQILQPRLSIRPGIFAYPTVLKSDLEITALSLLITLTPGTLALDIAPDGDTIYIHAMDIPNAEETIQEIKITFEKAIMEVTR